MSKNKGTLISSPIRPLTTGMTIPTAYSNELLGGLHSVSTTSERDMITSERRQFGMLVYIVNDDDFYQLKQVSSSDISDNLNWDLINISGVPTTTEWLDSVKTITGTPPGSPVIGDRYLVDSGGAGLWTGMDDYIVEWDGSFWVPTIPTDGSTLRVDDKIHSLYSYLGSSWEEQKFSNNPFIIKNDIPYNELIEVATGSQYLIYGDLNVGGTLDIWGELVLINGQITGTGSVGTYSNGSIDNLVLLTDIIVGSGLTVSSPTFSEREISLNIVAGTGVSFSTFGNELTINVDEVDMPEGRPKYLIESSEVITVPDYELYYIYGDLEVQGTLDIGTFGKVVITNGSLISSSGSTINNIGNIELYDLLTSSDNKIKVDVSELLYGSEGSILFESELKYIPILGTYARVVTESSDFVYKTSSSYVTSTSSSPLDRYLGLSTNDPKKKIHINGSGIIIDGSESEQNESLGDPNWARFVIDTESSDTDTLMDIRNDQGRVLYIDGDISGGFRFPSVSIGKTASEKIFNVSDYYGSDYFSIGATGTFTIGSMSEFNWIDQSTTGFDKYLVRDDVTGQISYRMGSWGQDCVSYQYQTDHDRLLGIGATPSDIDSKVTILTDGVIGGSTSYMYSALKVNLTGASAVNNSIYSAWFGGGIGVYTDRLLISNTFSVATFSNDNSLGDLLVWDSSTNEIKYTNGFGGVQAQSQPANLNKTAHGLNSSRLCDGSIQIMAEVYDDDNSYDHTTGIWTCPVTGRYNLSFFVTYMRSIDDGWFSNFINGSFLAGITSPTGCSYYCVNNFTINNISKHASISGQAIGLRITSGTQLCLKVINLTDYDYTSTSGDLVRLSIERVR